MASDRLCDESWPGHRNIGNPTITRKPSHRMWSAVLGAWLATDGWYAIYLCGANLEAHSRHSPYNQPPQSSPSSGGGGTKLRSGSALGVGPPASDSASAASPTPAETLNAPTSDGRRAHRGRCPSRGRRSLTVHLRARKRRRRMWLHQMEVAMPTAPWASAQPCGRRTTRGSRARRRSASWPASEREAGSRQDQCRNRSGCC